MIYVIATCISMMGAAHPESERCSIPGDANVFFTSLSACEERANYFNKLIAGNSMNQHGVCFQKPTWTPAGR